MFELKYDLIFRRNHMQRGIVRKKIVESKRFISKLLNIYTLHTVATA